MWGEARSRYEALLAQDVSLLRNFRADYRSLIFGVGSIWSPRYHRLVPFMAFSTADIPTRLSTWTKHRELVEINAVGWPLPTPRTILPLHAMLLEPPRPASAALYDVERVAGWIDDYVRFREPIICKASNSRGSGAILVFDDVNRRFGILSAGHVFPNGIGSAVELELARALFFSKRVPLGRVSHCIVPPPGTAGYDVAVIDLNLLNQWDDRHRRPYLTDRIPLHRSTVAVKLRDRFIAPQPIVVHGAVSGMISQAAVMGQLVEVDYGQATWLNCWLVAPSGMLRSGDSGSAVFTREDSAFLGLYVGSSGFSKRPLFHYVQDGWSLQQNVLNGWNISY